MSNFVDGDHIKKESIILHYTKTALEISPIYMFLGAFVLWFYLNEIGMTPLFKDVSNSKLELVAPLLSLFPQRKIYTVDIIYS